VNRQRLKWNMMLIVAVLVSLIMIAGAPPVFSRPERPFASGGHQVTSAGPFNNPTSYTVTDLGSTTFPVHAINNNGQVVGGRYFWDSGQRIDLGSSLRANDLNDAGQIVGAYYHPDGNREAFLWQDLNGNGQVDPDEIQLLGRLGGDESQAYGVNNLGHVIGVASNDHNDPRPFLWKDGIMTDLGSFGGKYGVAFGINDAGQITGVSENSDWIKLPFLWQNGVMSSLGELGPEARGHAINNLGQITGNYRTADWSYIQFLWLPEPAYGLPAGMNSLGFRSTASGSNDHGQVVAGRTLWQAGIEIDIFDLFPPRFWLELAPKWPCV
jgi:probable HAF family extracellular repeat protein